MSDWDYGFTTFRMLANRIRGFYDLETERERQHWERTRLLFSIIHNTNSKHPKKAEQLMPFPWDQEKSAKALVKPLSAEEMDKIFAKRDAKMKAKLHNQSNGV